MSAELPLTMSTEKEQLRPKTLEYNNNNNNLKNILLNTKSKLLTQSTTPSPTTITKIPTPSPGMLRRSTSLRMRGDRFFGSPTTKPLNQQSNNTNCGSCNCYKNSLSKGHISDPYSYKTPTLDRQCPPTKSNKSPASVRKNPSTSNLNKTPTKQVVETSPTRQRSLSLSLSNQTLSPHTPPVSPDRGFDQDDDLDSLHSYSSIASSSMSCDHAYVARNGTTFSGRKMKYVVHCSSHAGQIGEEYLTPTQRAQRQIRRLKQLLEQAKIDLEQKDSDIFRLTKEVVELRLYKASLNSPDDSTTSDAALLTVRENTPQTPPDSGHFETITTNTTIITSDERSKLIEFYEKKLEDLSRQSNDETQKLKQEHNDRVEALLKTLAEVNERYCMVVPDYEAAKERIKDLEKELDNVVVQLNEKDEKHKQIYLKLYEGNKDEVCGNVNLTKMAASTSVINRVSVDDLLHQLHNTQIELDNIKDVCESADQHAYSAQTLLSAKEAVSLWVLGARKAMYRRLVEARGTKSELDPEVTLQFLKSAIYYFLTDKENHRGHLRAIESILGFTSDEISNINKATNT